MSAIQQMLLGEAATTAVTDPYFANVISLLHFDGTNGSTTITDQKSKTWTATASAALSTTQAKFGATSLSVPNSGRITSTTAAGDSFGTGDFTLEWWQYLTATSAADIIFDSRTSGNETKPTVYLTTTTLNYYVLGSVRIAGTAALSTGAWQHIAVSRVSGTTRMFVNGTQVGSSWTDATNYNNTIMVLGDSSYSFGTPISGYIDDFRATKGVGRYASNFTPAGPFPDA